MNSTSLDITSITISIEPRRKDRDTSAFVSEPIPEAAWTKAIAQLESAAADRRP